MLFMAMEVSDGSNLRCGSDFPWQNFRSEIWKSCWFLSCPHSHLFLLSLVHFKSAPQSLSLYWCETQLLLQRKAKYVWPFYAMCAGVLFHSFVCKCPRILTFSEKSMVHTCLNVFLNYSSLLLFCLFLYRYHILWVKFKSDLVG